jgi:xanthine dehydrogenase accessory factor
MYDDFYAKANELMQQGKPFATATVTYAEKPTSGKPGDKAIITEDGVMYGWIGGSCAQPSVIREALKALAMDECRLIRLSTSPEEQPPRQGLIDLPMICFSGGTLEILIEPQPPQPRLLIVGNLPVAQALVHLGRAMNYHVIAVDLDNAHGGMSHADEIVTSLDDIAGEINQATYVVVTTHGNYDELALEKVLKAHPIYVGLVASPRRAQAVREYLIGQGLTEAELLPLKSPAGLDIHSRRGDEIALSIMAEIVQRRRDPKWMDATTSSEKTQIAEQDEDWSGLAISSQSQEAMALDPICGMQVDISSAKYIYEHAGTIYYFCSAGCQKKFAENPEQYLGVEAPSGEAIDPVCQMTVDIATAKYMSEYDGLLVYFCSAGCKKEFDLHPYQYVGDQAPEDINRT